MRRNRINPNAAGQRRGLRLAGFVCLITGGVLAAIGVSDFVSTMSQGFNHTTDPAWTHQPQLGGAVITGIDPVTGRLVLRDPPPPSKFWYALIGFPLAVAGAIMLRLGYMGIAARYIAGEAVPVMTDTFKYVAEETQTGVRTMTAAITEGIRGEAAPSHPIATNTCPECKAEHDPTAQFCDQCGFKFAASTACSSCQTENDINARFCDNCGQPIRA